jgi:hypothetical protein
VRLIVLPGPTVSPRCITPLGRILFNSSLILRHMIVTMYVPCAQVAIENSSPTTRTNQNDFRLLRLTGIFSGLAGITLASTASNTAGSRMHQNKAIRPSPLIVSEMESLRIQMGSLTFNAPQKLLRSTNL